MPLSVLLPLVVVGIALIWGLVRWLQPTPPLRIRDETEARAIWHHRNPETPAQTARINPGRSHALVETGAGPGLVWAMGADPVTRLIPPGTRCVETATGLRLKTGDFTAPVIDIPLPDPRERAQWAEILRQHTCPN